MSEFNNRIDSQRRILQTINSTLRNKEEIHGLSAAAIDRWSRANTIDPSDYILSLVREVADKLFFLSNKSQEQITEEYFALSAEVDHLSLRIKIACLHQAAQHPRRPPISTVLAPD